MKIIYYIFFHSIITYGIIAWGGACNKNLSLLQSRQSNILKCVNKNNFMENAPCNIKQLFTLESLCYHYEKLKSNFESSTSCIRYKSIKLPKNSKKVSNKLNYVEAIKTFNSLSNELKTLAQNKSKKKEILKEWVQKNI